jgi:transposase-like protein
MMRPDQAQLRGSAGGALGAHPPLGQSFRTDDWTQLRKGRPKPHATWHLDEVYLKIDGRMAYLWRAVDAEGEGLDVLVSIQAQ